MNFNFSPHTLFESKLSGTTPENIIKKARSLGRKYIAYTDFGLMSAFVKVYFLALQNDIKPVLGLQCFLKTHKFNDNKTIKYFTTTLYATNSEQYAFLCELASRQNDTALFYQETMPAIGWEDLEAAASKGLYLVTSSVHDITSKLILINDNLGFIKTHQYLKTLFGDRYYISLIGQKYDKEWMNLIKVNTVDNKVVILNYTDIICTNLAYKIKASDLLKTNRHTEILSVYRNNIYNKLNNCYISSVEDTSGFVQLHAGDIQLNINKANYLMAQKLGIPVMYSDYAFYAEISDKIAQSVQLGQDNLKDYPKRYMQSTDQAVEYLTKEMGLSISEINNIFQTNDKFSSFFDNFSINTDYKLPAYPGNVIKYFLEIIKQNNRFNLQDPVYFQRLAKEINILQKNKTINLLNYFVPIFKIIEFYKQQKRLVGPSRGSAGGSLLLYGLGITHIDPIKYDLSFERFLSVDRIMAGDLPDVDVDLVCREPLVGSDSVSGFLYENWKDCAAQISTRTLLRLKSSIKDVNRHIKGKVEPEIERLSKALPSAPQGINDLDFIFGMTIDGKKTSGLIDINDDLNYYIKTWPEEWEIVQKCLGLSRQFSKHASAFIISNEPINKHIPLFLGKTTQYEAKWVEKLGFIKYDFLVVNHLKDIELCLEFVRNKNQCPNSFLADEFIFNNQKVSIWNLPELPEVFKSIWDGDTHSIFQINTSAMIPFVKKIKPQSIEDLSTILALVRPGPLDYVDPETGLNMAEEYILRRNGKATAKIPKLLEMLPETYGVMCYQEQVSKIAKELGGMDPSDAEKLRRFFAKKQKAQALLMKPVFMENAVKNISPEIAEQIWDQMETFSRYGFNKSHSIGYAHITYACMFLRYFYPLEWWAAILSNASEEEIKTELYEKVKDIMGKVDINLSDKTVKIDYANNKIIPKLSLISGLGDVAMNSIIQNRPYKSLEDFVRKQPVGPSIAYVLIYAGLLDSLFDSNLTDLEKLHKYEETRNLIQHEQARLKNPKATLKAAKIKPEYLTITPLERFKIIKKTMPNTPEKLSDLLIANNVFKDYLKVNDKYIITNKKTNKSYVFLSGDSFKAVQDTLKSEHALICTPGFILQIKEVPYSKGTKKFLKMSVDIDGFVSEQILWPNYNSNELSYDTNIKKNSIVLLYFYINKNKNKLVLQNIENLC